jgi:hypothetical protein
MFYCFWIGFDIWIACQCFGQSISVGAMGGVLTTNDLTDNGATSVSKRYVVGPAVDIGLPFGLGVEIDALYRREGYQSYFATSAPAFSPMNAPTPESFR